MTKILIDRETVVQLVRMLSRCLDDAIQVQCDLAQGYSKSLALAQMVQVELSKEALTAGRAALANAEPRKVEPYAWRNPMNGVVISNDKKEKLLCVGNGYPNFSEPLYVAGVQP